VIQYFGSKRGIAALYPEPEYGHIIEPFAGMAGYALRYYDRKVTLLETNPDVVLIWKLIQKGSRWLDKNLPEVLVRGTNVRTMGGVSEEVRILLYYCANFYMCCRRYTVTQPSVTLQGDNYGRS
jgi:site-specific DNA-adenine methylase